MQDVTSGVISSLLATLVALSMLLLLQCDVVRGINVALHGQVSPKEFVVGSAVTCEDAYCL